MATLRIMVLMLLLAACVYIGSYFALARRGDSEMYAVSTSYYPKYTMLPRGASLVAKGIFKPVHGLDRQFIRPSMWEAKGGIIDMILADLARQPAPRAASSAVPNWRGGANGRQPFSSETNSRSAAVASRRSP